MWTVAHPGSLVSVGACPSCPSAIVGAGSDLLSTSTGSVLVDGAAGAAAGYFLAPVAAQRVTYAVVGGALTALGGLFGLALLGVYIFAKR